MKHYDYLGFSINVGTEVVFIECGYRNYKRGIVAKLGDHKATIHWTTANDTKRQTTRRYDDLIKIYIDKT